MLKFGPRPGQGWNLHLQGVCVCVCSKWPFNWRGREGEGLKSVAPYNKNGVAQGNENNTQRPSRLSWLVLGAWRTRLCVRGCVVVCVCVCVCVCARVCVGHKQQMTLIHGQPPVIIASLSGQVPSWQAGRHYVWLVYIEGINLLPISFHTPPPIFLDSVLDISSWFVPPNCFDVGQTDSVYDPIYASLFGILGVRQNLLLKKRCGFRPRNDENAGAWFM